jgi:hypothetical protein
MPQLTGTVACYWRRLCTVEKLWPLRSRTWIAYHFALPSQTYNMPALGRARARWNRARGWEGSASQQVNLATVTDPVTGEEVPFIPRRQQTGHQHATPQRFRELLRSCFTSFVNAPGQSEPTIQLAAQPWHALVATGACGGHNCSTDGATIRETGMVLMNGSVLCRRCHRKWEPHVRKELGFHRTPKCLRDVTDVA